MEIGSSTWKEMIVDGARGLDVVVQPSQADQFAEHAHILQEWNRKMNLTAIDSAPDTAVKHFLDSIVPSRFIRPDSRLLDVGSGAGFPGVPLKVMLPSLKVTLVDAVRKKVSFLKHVIQQLQLSDIEAIHCRLEDLPKQGTGEFDVIVCRAFSSLSDFVEKSLPLLASGGLLLALKGGNLEAEVRQGSAGQTGSSIFSVSGKGPHRQLQLQMKVVRYQLPFLALSRTLVRLTR